MLDMSTGVDPGLVHTGEDQHRTDTVPCSHQGTLNGGSTENYNGGEC